MKLSEKLRNDRNLDCTFKSILLISGKKKRKNMRQNLCALIQGIPWQKIDFCNRFRSLNSWTESDLKLFMLLKGNSLQICTAATTLLHEIIFHILVSISSFCFNSFLEEKPLISFFLCSLKSVSISSFCFNSFLEEKPLISFLLCSLKSDWTFIFIFPFIIVLKKILHFLYFKLMINLLVTMS